MKHFFNSFSNTGLMKHEDWSRAQRMIKSKSSLKILKLKKVWQDFWRDFIEWYAYNSQHELALCFQDVLKKE